MNPTPARDVIQALAEQAHCTREEARDAYERELARLDAQARITLYVPVLAHRHAREALESRHRGSPRRKV